jgi:nucleoid DNA-binding protein
MNKEHFSKYIADNLNISKRSANIIIETFVENLNQAIGEGNAVELDELGTFIPTTKYGKHLNVFIEPKFIAGKLSRAKLAS